MGASLIEADVAVVGRGRRRARGCAEAWSPPAATSSSSRRGTASAVGSGTRRSAARRTSSEASGSRRTSRGSMRSSPSSASSSSPRIETATTSTSTSRAAHTGTQARARTLVVRNERALEEGDAKLDALAKELDPEAPWEHPRARELDTITFDEWLRTEVGDRPRETPPLVPRGRLPDEARVLVLASPGSLGDRRRRRDVRAVRARSSASLIAWSAARS